MNDQASYGSILDHLEKAQDHLTWARNAATRRYQEPDHWTFDIDDLLGEIAQLRINLGYTEARHRDLLGSSMGSSQGPPSGPPADDVHHEGDTDVEGSHDDEGGTMGQGNEDVDLTDASAETVRLLLQSMERKAQRQAKYGPSEDTE